MTYYRIKLVRENFCGAMGTGGGSMIGWRIQWKKKWFPFWMSHATLLRYNTYEEADAEIKQIIEGDKVRHA